MYIMDDVQCADIHAGQPSHHTSVSVHGFVVIQILGGNKTTSRSDLLLGYPIHAAVDSIQEAFCQIGAGAGELRPLA